MTYETILNDLMQMHDEKFKSFSSKLTKTKYDIIGVQVPKVKALAKEVSKSDCFLSVINENTKFYEMVMLQGYTIAYSKIAIEEKIVLLNEFVNKIDDWAICDTLASLLKIKSELYFNQCLAWCDSKEEFICRFGIINLMSHYIDDNHINVVIDKIVQVKNEAYYVQMGQAWFIQKLYTKYFDLSQGVLENKNISEIVRKKALQKIRESRYYIK